MMRRLLLLASCLLLMGYTECGVQLPDPPQQCANRFCYQATEHCVDTDAGACVDRVVTICDCWDGGSK